MPNKIFPLFDSKSRKNMAFLQPAVVAGQNILLTKVVCCFTKYHISFMLFVKLSWFFTKRQQLLIACKTVAEQHRPSPSIRTTQRLL